MQLDPRCGVINARKWGSQNGQRIRMGGDWWRRRLGKAAVQARRVLRSVECSWLAWPCARRAAKRVEWTLLTSCRHSSPEKVSEQSEFREPMNPQSSRVPGCPASCQRAWRRIYKSARYQNELRTHPPIPRPLKQRPFHLTQARASLYMLAEVVETRGRPAAIEMRGRRAGCGLEAPNVIEHSTKMAGGVYIMRPQPADPSRSALPSPAAPSSSSSSSSFPRLAFLPGLHVLALSMINLLLVLALTSSSFIAPSRCGPVDWLRKLASPPTLGSARDDGS